MRRQTFLSLALLSACGGTSTSSRDAGASVDAAVIPDAAPTPIMLSAGANDQQTVQAALISVVPGQKILLAEGTYKFTDGLSLTVNNVTIQAMGDRDKTILDFSMQKTGVAALQVNANDFVLQGVTVQDTASSSVRVDNGTNVTFRNVKVWWTRGPSMMNAGYALYPVGCTNVLIENCEIHGASDAGIYVGQSKNILVRNNTVTQNVNGIEIENSTGAEVTGNTATDNTGGILVFALPNLQVKSTGQVVVHDNMIIGNNRASFAAAGGVASFVPPGSGMVVLAADTTEIRNNTIMNNDSVGIVLAACSTLGSLSSGAVKCNDPGYDIYPEGDYIHDNTFSGNGTAPQNFFLLFVDQNGHLQDIAWDGVVDSTKVDPNGANKLCIQNNGTATFVQVDPSSLGHNLKYDLAPFNCTHPSVPSIMATWGGS
jgi:parallel beta-helix repeat protein